MFDPGGHNLARSPNLKDGTVKLILGMLPCTTTVACSTAEEGVVLQLLLSCTPCGAIGARVNKVVGEPIQGNAPGKPPPLEAKGSF